MSIAMKRLNHGLTITELLVVVAILGVVAGVSINSGLQEWRREQVNAVAIELAGWLEQVRRSALRGRGCFVTVNGPSAMALLGAGNTVASSNIIAGSPSSITDPNACLVNSPLRIPENVSGAQFSVSSKSITFTPRGSVILSETPTDIAITLSGTSMARCVRINGLLGLIEISKSPNCGNQERF